MTMSLMYSRVKKGMRYLQMHWEAWNYPLGHSLRQMSSVRTAEVVEIAEKQIVEELRYEPSEEHWE